MIVTNQPGSRTDLELSGSRIDGVMRLEFMLEKRVQACVLVGQFCPGRGHVWVQSVLQIFDKGDMY